MKKSRSVEEENRSVEPIPNHTGQRYPGTGGKVRAPSMKDCVDEMESQPDRELDVQQAGEDAW
jgi:hypothetical protein